MDSSWVQICTGDNNLSRRDLNDNIQRDLNDNGPSKANVKSLKHQPNFILDVRNLVTADLDTVDYLMQTIH